MDRIDTLLRTSAPFGPWTPNAAVDDVERGKQLRCMGGIVACHCGSDHPLIATLRDAELDGDALQRAAAMLDRLPMLVQRRVISTFGAVTWPPRRTLR
jgi:hypothetical protein